MSKLQTSWRLDTIPDIIVQLRAARYRVTLAISREQKDFALTAEHYHEVRLDSLLGSKVGQAVVVSEEVAL